MTSSREAPRSSSSVAILGPGAVGTVFAVSLAATARAVVCVGRGETVAAIRRDGLTLVRHDSVVTARPDAVEALEDAVGLLLVTVKAGALEDALARVVTAPAAVVPLLNGLEHVDRLRRTFGNRVIAATVGRLEAVRRTPTETVQTTEHRPLVTLAPNGVGAAAILRSAGIEVRTAPDERTVLWEKAVRLAPLAGATAAAERPVGELRADRAWRARLFAALSEACGVAAADGAEVDVPGQWAIIEAMPPGLTTSTARDIAAGRPSELDAITGAVIRAGRRLGVATPTLDGLLAEAEGRCRASSA